MPRTLVTNNDVIRFVLTREGLTTPIVSKVTDAGITQEDTGWAQLTLSASDLLRSKFDENYNYEYDLEIQEGDTSEQWPLAHGPFEIDLQAQ